MKKMKRSSNSNLRDISSGPKKEELAMDLALVFWNNKTFGGRLSVSEDEEVQDKLMDSVELIVGQGGDGSITIIPIRVGDLNIPDEAIVSTLPSTSYYYTPYMKSVSNIISPIAS